MTAPLPSRSSSPDWTDANVHDPGITLLELVVYTVLALVVGVIMFNTWKSRHATRINRTPVGARRDHDSQCTTPMTQRGSR